MRISIHRNPASIHHHHHHLRSLSPLLSLPAASKEKAKATKIKKKWIHKQKLQSWWSPDRGCSSSSRLVTPTGTGDGGRLPLPVRSPRFWGEWRSLWQPGSRPDCRAWRTSAAGVWVSSPVWQELKTLNSRFSSVNTSTWSAAGQTGLFSLHRTLRWCLVHQCFSAGDASRTPSWLAADNLS